MELDYQKDPSLLAKLIDGMPVGFFTVNELGEFVSWSDGATRITGYSREDVLGRSCTMLGAGQQKGFGSLPEILSAHSPSTADGVHRQEYKVLARDGRALQLHGSIRLLRDDLGKPKGAIGCFRDVTEFVLAYQKIEMLEEQTCQRDAFEQLIGASQPMQEVYRRLRLAAQTDVTAFISGEPGTGKETAARAIHSVSDRRAKPFIAVRCSAIPDPLLESELFGHVEGAFPGAVRDQVGMFEAADGGTLFLDEIEEVSPLLQLKLLRVLQERGIRRVGSDKPVPIDVRIIAATSKDVREQISRGEFREDFYYRIHVFDIRLPPLRDRREDVTLLANQFLREISSRQVRAVNSFSRDAMQRLLDYDWPGNVRELRNAIEHAMTTVADNRITLFDLPSEIRNPSARRNFQRMPDGTRRIKSTAPATIPVDKLTPKQREERDQLLRVLEETGGNKTAAARILGFSRVTMWKKVSKYGID
ncbi:MAG: sigma 54-interacting transcriptional regulator [Planctomycetaceae bacterium]